MWVHLAPHVTGRRAGDLLHGQDVHSEALEARHLALVAAAGAIPCSDAHPAGYHLVAVRAGQAGQRAAGQCSASSVATLAVGFLVSPVRVEFLPALALDKLLDPRHVVESNPPAQTVREVP